MTLSWLGIVEEDTAEAVLDPGPFPKLVRSNWICSHPNPSAKDKITAQKPKFGVRNPTKSKIGEMNGTHVATTTFRCSHAFNKPIRAKIACVRAKSLQLLNNTNVGNVFRGRKSSEKQITRRDSGA